MAYYGYIKYAIHTRARARTYARAQGWKLMRMRCGYLINRARASAKNAKLESNFGFENLIIGPYPSF